MSGELESCPFCGGEASLTIPSELVVADCADIYVACDECESEGQHIVVEMRDRGDDLWPYECRQAIPAWNTRTTPPARTYAEGVADSAARCDSAAKQAEEVADQCSTGQGAHNLRVRASAARCLAAAIRLLSQGAGKA